MSDFSTFFHVSEYGEEGYSALARMLAVSAQVKLWAPSSVLFSSKLSSLTPKEFVDFVERGAIQVLGREDWLLSPKVRNAHKWKGAAWIPDVDGALKGFAEKDHDLPRSERRVVVVGEARGWERADEFLDESPEEARRLAQELREGKAGAQVPVGVMEAAAREAPEKVARALIKDAFNHADAFTASQARVPFFMDGPESRFLSRILDSIEPDNSAEKARDGKNDNGDFATRLVEQLVGLLERLNETRRPTDLSDFLGSDSHMQLIEWMEFLYDKAQPNSKLGQSDELVVGMLKQQLAESDFGRFGREWLSRDQPIDKVDALGDVMTIGGFAADPSGKWGIAGMAVKGASVARANLRRLGWVASSTYRGPSWPYLYAFGERPTQKRYETLTRLLDTPVVG